uniref:Oxysterol-binding protein n=1 Tax=Gadus morhua TaxID=8049 RepID=A0A8C5B7V0_GADMO
MTSGLEKAPPSWNKPCHSRSSSTASSPQSRQNIKDWEVMDELPMEVQTGSDKPPDMTVPGICEGYMLKRRKWPLKGWHKRYFVLEAGILRYSKNQQDISRGRIQGSLDVSVAVMSMNKKTYRIDLDTGDILYHVKAGTAAGGRPSRGPPSLSDSVEEFFDASDDVQRASWSEASDESGLSEGTTSNSEPDEGRGEDRTSTEPVQTSKDLSRVSMPAPLNEPINLLQRLCEELEYSELLDTASRTADPYQRMVYVAAFAISGYSSAIFRNRYKPFNPVLGETYECVREDRGFRMISEQVSHHPPISACHAESDNFSFWQDQRWKNKFWGKSLEIVPTGMVNLKIPSYGDHYEWNKVVTCIHNVLSQQRYLEHYGEVTITNLSSPACTCRITFVKARYWGSETTKNEVQGTVLDQGGSIIHRFGGLWHEGIYCDTLPTPKCIWKPNPQPKDHLLYYGFSLFAIELNELTPELKTLLPPTDSRLRPDQRMLEDGMVEESDKKKDELEEMQRERRRQMTKRGEEHIPRFFKQGRDAAGRDVWETNGSYWKLREKPGFANVERMSLW